MEPLNQRFHTEMVRVARLELAASWSQTRRPTNWATPGFLRNIWVFVFAYFSPKWERSQEEKMQVQQRFSERTRIFPINTK